VGVYTQGRRFQTQISETDRARVRDAYTAKYGAPPTDAWVTQFIANRQGATE